MDHIVCIKNKADVGVVRKVSFGGMQFAVLPPLGALDPQPSARLASEMVASREFCYLGHEDEEDRKARLKAVRMGPPTLEELRAKAALEAAKGTVEASGLLKKAAEIGQAQSKAIIDGQIRAAEAVQKFLKRHTPPSYDELSAAIRNAEAEPAPAKDHSNVVTSFSDDVGREAAILGAVAEMSAFTGDVDANPATATPVDLDAMSEPDLRKMARDAGMAGWRDASRSKLIKMLRK